MASALKYLALAACILLAAPIALAQGTPPLTHSFDVATIKPIPPDGRPHGIVGLINHPDGMDGSWVTLPDLLCFAYDYKSLRFDGQITGLPDWALKQRYDITAKMSSPDAAAFQKLSKDEQTLWREQMMQSLLAERFSLTLHHGAKQIPAYELVVAKGGIKMRDAATDPTPPQLGKDDQGKPKTDLRFLKDTTIFQANAMSSLADLLSLPAAQVGRPVVDKTGLTGTYNYTLDWSIYSASAAASTAPGNEATSIFTALGEIGLKLQPSTASFDTLVIDHVDHPTPD